MFGKKPARPMPLTAMATALTEVDRSLRLRDSAVRKGFGATLTLRLKDVERPPTWTIPQHTAVNDAIKQIAEMIAEEAHKP